MAGAAANPVTGPEGVTHKRILNTAVPIVLSNATVPILGAVDTGVVGQMGSAIPIGAVGIGAIILSAVYWVFGFLRMGTVGLTSQARGAGDTPEATALLSRAMLIGLTAGLVLILLQIPVFWAGFQLSPASPEVEALARDYMEIRIWSSPAAISVYGITGWLIAQERARAVFAVQLWMNGLNIVLDLIFVLGFEWGVTGVAWATFIAEWSGMALGLWFCRDAFRTPYWREARRVFEAAKLRRMAVVNSDIMIRSVLLEAIFVSFMFFGARFDDVTLAANQILLQFLFITAFAMDGFAFAVETLVGQALGAKNRAMLRKGALMCSGWSMAIGLFLAAVFALLGQMIIDIMATAPDVRAAAGTYLIYMILAPLLGAAAWMLDGIFIGATRTADMRNSMAITAAIYFAVAYPLMGWIGNHGLWVALLLSFVLRGILLGWRYPALEATADRD